MRSRLSLLILGALLAAPPALAAQRAGTVGPGMTMEEVRAALGAPGVVREAEGWTYYFYSNRCLPRCGTDDTVFFRDGRVVAAVLHSPARRYSGPAAAPALGAATAEDAREPHTPATVTGIRVRTREPVPEAPVDLGVISGRMRATRAAAETAPAEVAEPDAEPDAPDAAAAGPAGAAPRTPPAVAQPAAPVQPAPRPVDTRTREERLEPNTIRRPPRP